MAWTERYVRDDANGSGNGTTDANSGANGAWTLAQALAGVAAGHRVNVRAGTYANTTTSRTFGTNGTATAPIWWRGFKTTAGDLDAQPTVNRVAGTDMPLLTFTTGVAAVNGTYQIFTDIHFFATNDGGAATVSVTPGAAQSNCVFIRCRSVHNDNQPAWYCSAVYTTWVACNGETVNGARAWYIQNGSLRLIGCVGRSFNFIGFDFEANNVLFQNCIAHNCGTDGFYVRGGSAGYLVNCTALANGSHGIHIPTASGNVQVIVNCLLASNGGYGINHAGAAEAIVALANSFYNNTSGQTNGLGDWPSLYALTETVLPVESTTDPRLVAAALARAGGVPAIFEMNDAFRHYIDVGAVHYQVDTIEPRPFRTSLGARMVRW
jgi:hypothetical protein